MNIFSERIEDYQIHLSGPPKSGFINFLSHYLGEFISLLYYGPRHIAEDLDVKTREEKDRIVRLPLINIKEIMTGLSLFLSTLGIISLVCSANITAICFFVPSLLAAIAATRLINPVISVINGPNQDTVAYLTSSRTPGSRGVLDGFRKIFWWDQFRAKTPYVGFMFDSTNGRHAITATRFNNYMTEEKYILRTFRSSYQIFTDLFGDWAKDPKSRTIAVEIGLATLRVMAESILGFNETPQKVVDILDEIEDMFANQTPYWEFMGFKIAITNSQRRYLAARTHYREVAREYMELNKKYVVKHNDNFTMDLARMVASVLGGPDANPVDYLDDIEVQNGSLAMMLASNNPSTMIMGTMYILRNYPEETTKLVNTINKLMAETNNMGEEEKLDHLYKRTKACVGIEEISYFYSECLRFTTPVSLVGRSCPFKININNKELPDGSLMLTNVRSQCRDPEQWERPDEFLPDRFKDTKYLLHTWPFVPFSVGERKCPGIMTTRAIFFGFLFAFAGKYRVEDDPNRPPFTLLGNNAVNRVSRIHRSYVIKM